MWERLHIPAFGSLSCPQLLSLRVHSQSRSVPLPWCSDEGLMQAIPEGSLGASHALPFFLRLSSALRSILLDLLRSLILSLDF